MRVISLVQTSLLTAAVDVLFAGAAWLLLAGRGEAEEVPDGVARVVSHPIHGYAINRGGGQNRPARVERVVGKSDSDPGEIEGSAADERLIRPFRSVLWDLLKNHRQDLRPVLLSDLIKVPGRGGGPAEVTAEIEMAPRDDTT